MISMPTATSGDTGPLRGRVHRPARRSSPASPLPASPRSRWTARRYSATPAPFDLDEGVRHLVGAQPDGLLELLTGQDWLSVTGSWETAYALRRHPVILINAIRFTAEADSLNAVIRGGRNPERSGVRHLRQGPRRRDDPEGGPEVHRHLPRLRLASYSMTWRPSSPSGLRRSSSGTPPTSPCEWSAGQPAATRGRPRLDRQARGWGRRVFDDPESVPKNLAPGADFDRGAFLSPLLLAEDLTGPSRHTIEGFEQVATLLPHKGIEAAIGYVALGEAISLPASSPPTRTWPAGHARYRTVARRVLELNRGNAAESTGHGTAVPRGAQRSWPCRWRRGTS